MTDENKYYSCSDLGLSCVISLNYPIEAISKINPSKVEFFFPRSKELDDLIESYWRGELRIEPKQYFSQLKMLKSRIYEER